MLKRVLVALLILFSMTLSGAPHFAPVSAQEKPYGGTLTIGVTGSVKSLNPARIENYDWVTYCLYYDFLWVYDTDFNPVPYLAESWTISPDGLTTTFHLRHNATWSDGVPLTANDVKFTFDTIMWDPIWQYAIAGVNSAEVVDDYTVAFHQSTPRARPPMPYSMIIPQHIWEPMLKDRGLLDAVLAHNQTAIGKMAEFENNPLIGSGMYKLKAWVPGEYEDLQANDNWWGGRPYVDELIFKEYASADVALVALKNGEIDAIGYGTHIPGSTVKDLESNPGITVLDLPSLSDIALSFNLWDGWIKVHPEAASIHDINVRRAFAHIIDRQTIVNVLYYGYATPIYSYIPPALTYWYNPNVTKYDFDLAKAADILDKAGYKVGADGIRVSPSGLKLSFELVTDSADSRRVRITETIRDNAKQVGIDLQLKTVDYSTLSDMVYYTTGGPQYTISVNNQMEASPDPDWVSTFFYNFTPGSWDFQAYKNPEYDKLWNAQTSNPDKVSRRGQIFRMQQIISDDLPAIPIVSEDSLSPIRSDKWVFPVKEVGGTFNWIMPWWNAHEVHLKQAATTAPTTTATTATTETTTTPAAPDWTPTIATVAIIVIAIALTSYMFLRRRGPKQK